MQTSGTISDIDYVTSQHTDVSYNGPYVTKYIFKCV